MTALIIGDTGIARSITQAIAAGTHTPNQAVTALTDTDVLDDPALAARALATLIGDEPVELVVFAHLDPAGFVSAAITDITEDAWDQACERSLRQAFVALQQVHSLVADGTPVVVVLPNVGAVGVAGLVPVCSAVEGIRVMAKAVARRWGARSITVNTIEVDLATFMLGGADDPDAAALLPQVPVLGAPALPAAPILDDVMGLIGFFASPAGRAVTGAFLMADRGTVMLP
jgi:NAD(P)-dependent dehydrogenase (short-subunit alcohol dehydrogenase family)